MGKKMSFYIGEKNNRLSILEEVEKEIQNSKGKVTPIRKIKCVCECGNIVTIRLSAFKSGYTKSCGCLRKEVFINKNKIDNTKHGLRSHPLYRVWFGMISRCYKKSNQAFKDYGGRGIFVCDEWLNDFKSFYNWAIENSWSIGLSIDRINNNSGYSPSNCRMANREIQSNNRRNNIVVNVSGVEMTLTQACRLLGVNYKSVNHLVKRGKSFDEAVKRQFELNRANN